MCKRKTKYVQLCIIYILCATHYDDDSVSLVFIINLTDNISNILLGVYGMRKYLFLLMAALVLVACGNDNADSGNVNDSNENINGAEDNEIDIERDPLPFDVEEVKKEYIDIFPEELESESYYIDETSIVIGNGNLIELDAMLRAVGNVYDSDELIELPLEVAKVLDEDGYYTGDHIVDGLNINIIAVDVHGITMNIFKEGD